MWIRSLDLFTTSFKNNVFLFFDFFNVYTDTNLGTINTQTEVFYLLTKGLNLIINNMIHVKIKASYE